MTAVRSFAKRFLLASVARMVGFTASTMGTDATIEIGTVARLKALPGQFTPTERWIRDQWDNWADIEDVYHLEEQCIAYYGVKVLDVADDIRREIGDGTGDSGTLRKHYISEIASRDSV